MKRIETCFAIIINLAQRVGYGNRKFGIFLITDKRDKVCYNIK